MHAAARKHQVIELDPTKILRRVNQAFPVRRMVMIRRQEAVVDYWVFNLVFLPFFAFLHILGCMA